MRSLANRRLYPEKVPPISDCGDFAAITPRRFSLHSRVVVKFPLLVRELVVPLAAAIVLLVTQATATISADALDARIENAAGFAHHRKKEFAKAATGFAKALALDPSFGIAATNLASAHVLAGNHKAAEATLKIELPRAGIAFSKTRNWLAFVLPENPGGASCSDHKDIVVVDAKTNRELARIAFAAPRGVTAAKDCEGDRINAAKRAQASRRRSAVKATLAAYGFDPIDGQVGVVNNLRRVYFSKSKTSVVAGNAFRAFRKGTLIGESAPGTEGYFMSGVMIASLNKALVVWAFDCAHNVDTNYFSVVDVAATPTTPTTPTTTPASPLL